MSFQLFTNPKGINNYFNFSFLVKQISLKQIKYKSKTNSSPKAITHHQQTPRDARGSDSTETLKLSKFY